MALIDDFAKDPNAARIAAATDPIFLKFIERDNDLESITIDLGDGRQAQVQAIKVPSIKPVLERIIASTRGTTADVERWICVEFRLCDRLDTAVGDLMRQLFAFLEQRWVTVALNLFGLFTGPQINAFIAIFSCLGLTHNALRELCKCDGEAQQATMA